MNQPESDIPDNQSLELLPCPASNNCVATDRCLPSQFMAPWPFLGDLDNTFQRLKSAIGRMPRMKIVALKKKHIQATATSLVFRFVDDVEFLLDTQSETIRFRSASRVGRYDLGKNRKRMETLREYYLAGWQPPIPKAQA